VGTAAFGCPASAKRGRKEFDLQIWICKDLDLKGRGFKPRRQ
jgi:hypothetical protein